MICMDHEISVSPSVKYLSLAIIILLSARGDDGERQGFRSRGKLISDPKCHDAKMTCHMILYANMVWILPEHGLIWFDHIQSVYRFRTVCPSNELVQSWRAQNFTDPTWDGKVLFGSMLQRDPAALVITGRSHGSFMARRRLKRTASIVWPTKP